MVYVVIMQLVLFVTTSDRQTITWCRIPAGTRVDRRIRYSDVVERLLSIEHGSWVDGPSVVSRCSAIKGQEESHR
jgi:hypothetical protein